MGISFSWISECWHILEKQLSLVEPTLNPSIKSSVNAIFSLGSPERKAKSTQIFRPILSCSITKWLFSGLCFQVFYQGLEITLSFFLVFNDLMITCLVLSPWVPQQAPQTHFWRHRRTVFWGIDLEGVVGRKSNISQVRDDLHMAFGFVASEVKAA